ncbi:hydrogenase expression/formation protein HypE [Candidatus Desantisbacteria bacterium CG1_02_38_46]|uniref:Hydrogenase expression/formation protein HypE n=3 Tax=unclassified Candidatus Desantisiibacteriota TaxID=3106372 RepID=A0A1J4SGH8_9BACT
MKNNERILLGHGSGGELMHNLIKDIFVKEFNNPILNRLNDGAVLNLGRNSRLAFTTDSYVVSPIFFKGGDIGSLAVYGTVNDLAMCAATPLYLSLSLIIEEGFSISDLKKIICSIKRAGSIAGISVITGDTKVVEKGKTDKIFINTSGIGVVHKNLSISGNNAKTGDKVILSGSIGDHGITILNERGNLGFKANLKSDCQPLNYLVLKMLKVSRKIHCLRDPTRGGLATSLNEIAIASKVGIEINESAIPIRREVRAACEMLGLDPIYVANEGKLVAIVAKDDAKAVLSVMKKSKWGRDAAIIGTVIKDSSGTVELKTTIGGTRVVQMLTGEQLPRIC